MTPLTTYLEAVRERTGRAANWRSADFGHDTQALLMAESGALQVAAKDTLLLVEMLERAVESLDEILYAGNVAAQGHWDDTAIMKDLAYESLKEIQSMASGKLTL